MAALRLPSCLRSVGLMTEDKDWQPWHRNQITDILNVVGAVECQAGENTGCEPLEFERIVGPEGQLGAGVCKTSRIVTT
jgi:hypothetical protein